MSKHTEAGEQIDDEQPAAPPKPPSMFALKPLDALERRVTFWAAAIGAVMSIALWAPAYFDPEAVVSSALGVVTSGGLAYAAYRRSRFLAGTAAFLVSFSLSVPGMLFLLLGMWLWFRGRPSPEEVAERRRLRDEAIAAKRAARRGKAPAPTAGRTPPKPSKRYTPPAGKR